jgi:hypothetical protein
MNRVCLAETETEASNHTGNIISACNGRSHLFPIAILANIAFGNKKAEEVSKIGSNFIGLG